MMYTIVPPDMLQNSQPQVPSLRQTIVNGVPVRVSGGIICDVLSTDPGDYLRLPHLSRVE
ncbi:MAG: hypothetical protein PHD32_02180 [Eubacteriales bacterium]|nr:hypothetical protein [Eubacteriales bacterium]